MQYIQIYAKNAADKREQMSLTLPLFHRWSLDLT